ncbi:alpha/beta fold hydrolase [Hwangdonia lutea]|uniref:Alpha/beta hydrolase n=1 Tax=Hwangdonia lutea TaxID=3075823 RepID=A0AA97ERS2_9FLAO|nr:alpha/beta hydrolase [Hwangdonia sp. SCSIO 19198]WOD44768.1 alpha/beta hydrolase [Hwangdonia sp. SCSIO 19198]
MILEYKGTQIFYTDKGKGQALVLLHGFLENSNMWNAFLPELTKNNRVICIDLLGHGQTGCMGYIHSMDLMADAVKAVLNHLKIKHSTFIGHSMGGYVALAFAERNPDAVSRLCLMNSTAEADSTEKKENRDRAVAAVKQNHKIFIRISINNLFRPKNRTIFSDDIKQIIAEALQTPLQGIIAALEGMKIRPNREAVLSSESFIVMMIMSKKDPVLDFSALVKQAKRARIKAVEFPDGHMSHIENKEDFLRSIVYFIEN